MKDLKFLFCLIACLAFTACKSGGEAQVTGEAVTNDEVKPQWYLLLPEDEEFFYGKGDALSAEAERAYEEAEDSALEDLTTVICLGIKSKIRDAIKTSGRLEMDDEEIERTFDKAILFTAKQTLSSMKIHRYLPAENGARCFLALKVKRSFVAAEAKNNLKKAINKKITDPQKKSNLRSMFEDDFFKCKK
jgi:hypothetical protein